MRRSCDSRRRTGYTSDLFFYCFPYDIKNSPCIIRAARRCRPGCLFRLLCDDDVEEIGIPAVFAAVVFHKIDAEAVLAGACQGSLDRRRVDFAFSGDDGARVFDVFITDIFENGEDTHADSFRELFFTRTALVDSYSYST